MVTLTASGSVSDYTDSDKSSLQQKVANAAGVDKSFVTISVAAASVRITATIAVPGPYHRISPSFFLVALEPQKQFLKKKKPFQITPISTTATHLNGTGQVRIQEFSKTGHMNHFLFKKRQ